jgi:hypothetical protein
MELIDLIAPLLQGVRTPGEGMWSVRFSPDLNRTQTGFSLLIPRLSAYNLLLEDKTLKCLPRKTSNEFREIEFYQVIECRGVR